MLPEDKPIVEAGWARTGSGLPFCMGSYLAWHLVTATSCNGERNMMSWRGNGVKGLC